MRAILHIGVEKTGTTTLQAVLASERTRLAKHGFIYSKAAGECSHWNLPIYAEPDLCQDLLSIVGPDGFKEPAFEKAIAEEVYRYPDSVFIFSSEHCHSRVRSGHAVRKIKDLLDRYFDEITIAVYLKRQDRIATSFYSTHLRGGGANFSPLDALSDFEYFDFSILIDRWSAVFGMRNVVVRISDHESLVGGSITRDFSELFCLPRLHEHRRCNASFSAPTQMLLRRFNQISPYDQSALALYVRDAFISVDDPSMGPPVLPARCDAISFVEMYKLSNDDVRRQFFPERDALFDDDFSLYPETLREGASETVLDSAVHAVSFAINRFLQEKSRAEANAAQWAAEVRIMEEASIGLRGDLGKCETELAYQKAELGYYKALVHLDANQIELAHSAVMEGLAAKSDHAMLWHMLARTLLMASNYQGSTFAAVRAAELDPFNSAHRKLKELIVKRTRPNYPPSRFRVNGLRSWAKNLMRSR